MEGSNRQLVKLRGMVRKKRVKRGTGSEHIGVVLTTEEGERLTLVRLGGNPFHDASTRALVGKEVVVEGYLIGNEMRYTAVRVEKK
jgi:hypothetical protein